MRRVCLAQAKIISRHGITHKAKYSGARSSVGVEIGRRMAKRV